MQLEIVQMSSTSENLEPIITEIHLHLSNNYDIYNKGKTRDDLKMALVF